MMKGYSGLYYLFFVLLIMGGFAAMAQNRYGLHILGAVGILYALLFLYQCFYILFRYEPKKRYLAIEPAGLALLSILITLRVFYIRFPFVEEIFGIVVLVLFLLYARRMDYFFNYYRSKNFPMALLSSAFYFTIMLYLFSMVSVAFWPRISFAAGIAAFALLMVLLIAGFLSRKSLIDGQHQSFFRFVLHLKDNSLFVISMFFLFTLYAGMTRLGILPKIYSDEYPQAYFDMINRSESGKVTDKEKDGNFQVFKEKYDQFIKNNIDKKQ